MKAKLFLLLITLCFLMPALNIAQTRYGAKFMQIGIGARQIGMGHTFTGVGDDLYTMFWNPGGLGFIRRWQWAAGYDRWFADTYQASILYARQFHFLGSRKFTIGVGGLYFGMPDWDSTEGGRSAVSANSTMGVVSIGQRLDWLNWPASIGKYLSIGVSVKVIQSKFADYTAFGTCADFGFMINPGRFNLGKMGLGLFDYGMVSLGATLQNNNISRLKYDQDFTDIPSSIKIGGAFSFGRHNGFSLLLAFDTGKYSDEERRNSLGAEIWWRRFIGTRLGYEMNGDNFGNFCLGFGVRLGGSSLTNWLLPGANNEMRLDFANTDYGDILKQTYRGNIIQYPNNPEPFGMIFPENFKTFNDTKIRLKWEKAEDPDPWDEVHYLLMVDTNNEDLAAAREELRQDSKRFLSSNAYKNLDLCYETTETTLDTIAPGRLLDYYWSVAALDKDGHIRIAHGSKHKERKFFVKRPDLVVQDIQLKPLKWITPRNDFRQGTLEIVIKNRGNAKSPPCDLAIWGINLADISTSRAELDSLLCQGKKLPETTIHFNPIQIKALPPNDSLTVTFEWNAEYIGKYRFCAKADLSDKIKDEMSEKNNVFFSTIYSIPKWDDNEIKIAAKKLFEVIAARYKSIEVPLVPMVFFNPGSASVKQEYVESDVVTDPISVVAQRLNDNRAVQVSIMGNTDPFTDPGQPQLKIDRANAVRNMFASYDVDETQLKVVSQAKLNRKRAYRKPADKTDEQRIQEENRFVELTVQHSIESQIFAPIEIPVPEIIPIRKDNPDIPKFRVNVIVPAGIKSWHLIIKNEDEIIKSITNQNFIRNNTIQGATLWRGRNNAGKLVDLDRQFQCYIEVVDGQNRSFKTETKKFFVREKVTILKEQIFALFYFAKAIPTFEFYRDRLIPIAEEFVKYNDDVRIRFEGHTCSIGSEKENLKLSLARARELTSGFLRILKKKSQNDPANYNYSKLSKRVDSAVGFGESEPLILNIPGEGEKLFGNNNSPTGRNLNRRVMILFYRE